MLKVSDLQKHYDNFSLKISFKITDVSYNIFLGPSGAGKSLTLKLLAGFEKPDSGQIFLDGQDLCKLPPESRPIVYLPQNLGLFPHITVKEQLEYPFKCQKSPVDRQVLEKVVHEFGLSHLLNRRPYNLSGGERQRLALARALMARPRLLLLDEPLSGIDFHLKMKLISFLKKVKEKFQLTLIHVTHDPIEALMLAENMAILEQGQIRFWGPLSGLFQENHQGFTSEIASQLAFLKKGLSDICK